jgi:hypothetical protein
MARVAEQTQQLVLGGIDVIGQGWSVGVDGSEMRGGIGTEAGG